ncbi:hypothetical protein Pph01_82100 [Planotetraspora phitsanulokensis]|uniref:Uncharacterized protein n=1 Tax=Planotetraspora phitsanulokensis TaxID=575192 RepID=A0A8J3XII6_9ACTN|nr:hypothetical protein Pph01_82100 [Planotetraspora phitsanulokensis]
MTYGTSRAAAIPTGRVHRESPGAGSRDEQPADHGFEVTAKTSGPAVGAASYGDHARAVRDRPSQLLDPDGRPGPFGHVSDPRLATSFLQVNFTRRIEL